MYDKQQLTVRCRTQCCITRLIVLTGIRPLYKRIKEHLAGIFKTDPMFADIQFRFGAIPFKLNTVR